MAVLDEYTGCETDVQLNGKVAVVAGATSGIGLQVAKDFARRGAKVIIASRNQTKLENAKADIIKSTGNNKIITRQMDFESLSAIRNFVDTTIRTEPRLDILVNSIGTIGLPDKLTLDHLQVTMQVSFYGTFLLTFLLFPLLKASAPSRVVTVTSIGMLLGDINFENWNKIGKYSDLGHYCNSKLGLQLFTVEMEKRIKGSGVGVYTVGPGLAKTEFFKNVENVVTRNFLNSILLKVGTPLNRVATLPVSVAIDPIFIGDSGKYFGDHCKEMYSHWSVNDTVLTGRMWKEFKRLVKITAYEDWERQ